MRPEVVAFRELDELVRKLTEQLSAYRRRALAAEAKNRELEQGIERAVEKGEAALSAARAETATVRRMLDEAHSGADGRGEGDPFPQPTSSRSDRPSAEPADLSMSSYGDIAVENERLRSKLGEARDRTSVLVERVRFLRQQIVQGEAR
ncbi:MAG TPA: hypothetical protein VE869_01350 [Gemmatimonas sp.]|nr:hypothetical protein [Gemmatimonas sp.]